MKKMKGAYQEVAPNWTLVKTSHTVVQLPQFERVLHGPITCYRIDGINLADDEETARFLNESYRAIKEELRATINSREEIEFDGQRKTMFIFWLIGE